MRWKRIWSVVLKVSLLAAVIITRHKYSWYYYSETYELLAEDVLSGIFASVPKMITDKKRKKERKPNKLVVSECQ